MTIEEKIDKTSSSLLLLDGAMGSLIQQKGFEPDEHLWTSAANFETPELVMNIHKNYISNGADIITTNTFRTNPLAVDSSDCSFTSEQLVNLATELAHKAAEGTDTLIAGSNAPAEDCYQKNRTVNADVLKDNHNRHIVYLMNAGVDFILNETFGHLDEIKIVCEICNENNFPFVISFFFDSDLKLLSGEPVSEALAIAKFYEPEVISFNCVKFSSFEKLFETYEMDFRWGFYLNCGTGNFTDSKIEACISPFEYANRIKKYFNDKLRIVGSCCGSSPAHTKVLREILNEIV